jgi:hypothetical protein
MSDDLTNYFDEHAGDPFVEGVRSELEWAEMLADCADLVRRADLIICALLNGHRDSTEIERWICNSRETVLMSIKRMEKQ